MGDSSRFSHPDNGGYSRGLKNGITLGLPFPMGESSQHLARAHSHSPGLTLNQEGVRLALLTLLFKFIFKHRFLTKSQ